MRNCNLPIVEIGFVCLSLSSVARADNAATELFQSYLGGGRIGNTDEKLLGLIAKATKNADAQLGLGLVCSARAFKKYRNRFIAMASGRSQTVMNCFLAAASAKL